MMTGAASGRSVLARWDGDGIELEGPSDVMTPENLSILSNYKPIIEAEARQRAGEWVALHELHELYELHFLLYGVDRKKKSPSFSSSCEVRWCLLIIALYDPRPRDKFLYSPRMILDSCGHGRGARCRGPIRISAQGCVRAN